MEIALGRRADYTLRGVLHLARQRDGELQPARMIAAATDVPANWLPQLLSTLVTAGLVESETGRRGGYRLAVAPADITVLAVIDAVEPDRDATCVLRGGPCHWEDRCAFHEPWADAKQALRDRLAMTTFADIVAIDDLLASGSGHPSGG